MTPYLVRWGTRFRAFSGPRGLFAKRSQRRATDSSLHNIYYATYGLGRLEGWLIAAGLEQFRAEFWTTNYIVLLVGALS
jgi:hypothetical protein